MRKYRVRFQNKKYECWDIEASGNVRKTAERSAYRELCRRIGAGEAVKCFVERTTFIG